MKGTFTYSNPTVLHFGPEAMASLAPELRKFGPVVQLVHGRGSARANGVLGQVEAVLKECGKTVVEDGGVMPNPTLARVRDGIRTARRAKPDLLLAAGGGSCCDYAKAVAACACGPDGALERHYHAGEPIAPGTRVLPVGCVLTMAGTGSEMNGTSVLTDEETRVKKGMHFGDRSFPRFAILNPLFTLSLPRYQMAAGVYDVFCHACEQYLAGEEDCASDHLAEGLMRAVVSAGRAAARDPLSYEARSNIMWAASWGLNTLLSMGKPRTDWMVHKLGQAVSAHTDATHGMTLAAVTLPYYRFLLPHGTRRLARFARTVWGIPGNGKTDMELAEEGLLALEAWMREMGLVLRLRELGATEENLGRIAGSVILKGGGYRIPTRAEALELLRQSL